MSPQYKLIYFNSRGGAEFIRFLFKYGGVDFDDVRLESDEWQRLKQDTPFGQLPLLEVDGKKFNQSKAIGRFVAKKVNLAGKDDWESLQIDAVVDTIQDFAMKFANWHYASDPERKEELKKVILEESAPYYLSRLDKIAQENGGHLALGRFTWVDFYFTTLFDNLDRVLGTSILASYSNLQAVIGNVTGIPAIKEWIVNRPESDH